MVEIAGAPALEARHIRWMRDHRAILEDVSWSVPPGARAAVLGPNGSGKTSLLRMVTGYLFPTTGSMSVLGETLGQTNLDELRRRMGIVDPTNIYLEADRLVAIDVVLSGFFGHLCIDFDYPTPSQVERAQKLLAAVGLEHRDQQRMSTLSTGEQRRVLVARAMACEPELLVLDEATAGLDLLAREQLLASVDHLVQQNPQLTLLVVTHHLEELPRGIDHVLVLSRGKVAAAGDPASVLTPAILSPAFGVPVQVTHEQGRWSWRVAQPAGAYSFGMR